VQLGGGQHGDAPGVGHHQLRGRGRARTQHHPPERGVGQPLREVVKGTAARRIRGWGTKFGWDTRVCRQVEDLRRQKKALFAGGSSPAGCSRWRSLAESLHLEPLSKCMRVVAESWWKDVAAPLGDYCESPARLSPAKFAVFLPHLAVSASRLQSRLVPWLQRFLVNCDEAVTTLTPLKVQTCAALRTSVMLDSGVELLGNTTVATPSTGVLLPDLDRLRERVKALAPGWRPPPRTPWMPPRAKRRQQPTGRSRVSPLA